jgi:hypothetical protein
LGFDAGGGAALLAAGDGFSSRTAGGVEGAVGFEASDADPLGLGLDGSAAADVVSGAGIGLLAVRAGLSSLVVRGCGCTAAGFAVSEPGPAAFGLGATVAAVAASAAGTGLLGARAVVSLVARAVAVTSGFG